MFKTLQSSGRAFGRIINSKPVSTISNVLEKGGRLAEKALDNPAVAGLAASAGPEGLALYGAAQGVARGSVGLGKGIQAVKKATNQTPFKPSYVSA